MLDPNREVNGMELCIHEWSVVNQLRAGARSWSLWIRDAHLGTFKRVTVATKDKQ